MMQQHDYFKSLTVLFTALIAGQLIFAAMAGYLVLSGAVESRYKDIENVLFILVPVLIIIGRLGGNMIFKTKIRSIHSTMGLKEKLDTYRTAFIIRCAMLQGSVIFAVIIFMLTQVIEMMAFVAGGIFLFYLLKPNKENIAAQLNVSPADIP